MRYTFFSLAVLSVSFFPFVIAPSSIAEHSAAPTVAPIRVAYAPALPYQFESAAYFFQSLSARSSDEQPSVAAASTIAVYSLLQESAKSMSTDPVRLIIPAVSVDSPIASVGVNDKGEMAVPNGNTNTVGWYKRGTVPGDVGSAVLDAHVFAAFQNIKDLKPGSDIYIVNAKNERFHFIVSDIQEYALDQLTPQMLFSRHDGRRLNLITCAGTFVQALGTYDRRVVVYAILADD